MSIDNAIKNAIASVEMEGYQLDQECIDWCKQLLANKITMEQYIEILKQKSGVALS